MSDDHPSDELAARRRRKAAQGKVVHPGTSVLAMGAAMPLAPTTAVTVDPRRSTFTVTVNGRRVDPSWVR